MNDARRLAAVCLVLTLIAYTLPWGVRVTGWRVPGSGDPHPTKWQHISGVRMGVDLGRVSLAQWVHTARLIGRGTLLPHLDEAALNLTLCIAHLTPLAVAAAMLCSMWFGRPRRVPLFARLIAMACLIFAVLHGPLRLYELAFRGAEWVGYPTYQYWEQSWVSGAFAAVVCFAAALVVDLRGSRPPAQNGGDGATETVSGHLAARGRAVMTQEEQG